MDELLLLETKLHAPRRRRELLPRPRLQELSEQTLERRLTLVSAPAGFGKTTLLGDWASAIAERHEISVAWLSLDGRDSEPAVFWAYVIAALQSALPGVGEQAAVLLRSPQATTDLVISALLNELHGAARGALLVLDDYHLIDGVDVHEGLAFFLERLPPQVRVVIGTRSDPPLALGRLRADGELLEVRARDLRFTQAEVASYLVDSVGIELSSDDVAALEARTEGWIVALQLAGLSMQGADDAHQFVTGFAGDDRFVVDYLADEVLHRQPDDVRDFLLQTSVLQRFDASLCAAVTGQVDAKAKLDLPDRRNLFLVPLDSQRRWYRYHHLFADVLRARLLDERPELVSELHRRASGWHAEHGDRTEAVQHSLAADDFERAAELIELAVPFMRQTRQETLLRRWLEALPDAVFPPRPVLSVARVGALMGTGDMEGVEPLLATVEQWLDPARTGGEEPLVFDHDEMRRLPAQVAVYRAGLALLHEDTQATVAHAARALSLMDPSDHLGRGAASALTGLAHWRVGDLAQARERYAESVECFVRAEFVSDVLGCSLGLADIQEAQGDLPAARQTFERALRHAEPHGPVRGTADMHVGLSELLLEANDLVGAAGHLRCSDELGDHGGLPQHPYRRRVALALLRSAEGDHVAALQLLDDAELVYDTDFSPSVRPIPALKARAHLAVGDLAAVERWRACVGATADDEPDYLREFDHLTLARALLAAHSTAALPFLERLLAAATDGGRAGTTIECRVLLAVAQERLGDRAAALESIGRALVTASPLGYVRTFLDAGPDAVRLVRTAAASPEVAPHAVPVLGSADEAPRPPAAAPLVGELSARELDVLRLLRSDLSGPDIASELLVSLNTLRTHTKNIYVKLGVNSRREAVTRARELGL